MQKISFITLAISCLLWPGITSGVALGLGFLFSIVFTNPFLDKSRHLTHRSLAIAVVGLGAGMNLETVVQVGLQGFGYTLIGIALALSLGYVLGRFFKVAPHTSFLISVGTAICGGSAIAAVVPILKPKAEEVSTALGIVFLLNSVALFIFPHIGHALQMSQEQFGLWSALAIHDTSSVVGATMAFGEQALQIGTTVKLARALWIVPLTLVLSLVLKSSKGEARKNPWFILGFLLTAAVFTWIPWLHPLGQTLDFAARRLLVLSLFLIGSTLDRQLLKAMGWRPFLQGLCLWLITAALSILTVQN